MILNHYVRKNLIIIVATCLIISALIFNVVSGYYRGLEASRGQTINEESSSAEIDDIDLNSDDIINADNKSTAENDEDTNNSAPSAPANTQQKNQSTYTAPPSSQQPEPKEQVTVCNEAMKSSYTDLYNSQVAAENANWDNQISQWQSDARERGVTFGGYVQSMIDDNQPGHDARLVELQTQYYQNLLSINCL